MYYEINVSKRDSINSNRYNHHFATAERSITDERKAREMTEQFRTLFPAPEYNVSCSQHRHTGAECEW